MRCLPLCEPDTFPVSSLTHTPPAGEKPSDSLSSRCGERRDGEPVAVHGGNRVVERRHQAAVARIGHPVSGGHVVGVHERAVAQKRVVLAAAGKRVPGRRSTRVITWSVSSVPARGHRNG